MKNFSKTIASVSMSLLTIGAFGQIVSSPLQNTLTKPKAFKTASPGAKIKARNAHSAMSANYGLIDYIDGDSFQSGQPIIRWSPLMYINRDFVLADTINSSSTVNDALTTAATVVFDTLWDNYSQGYVPVGTGVKIDTIDAYMGYTNTSGANDTLYVKVCGVTPAGYAKLGTVYYSTTVILNSSGPFQYNSLDSVQLLQIPVGITIPSSAVAGWRFCINVTVGGSKLDTVGLQYYSQYATCTSPYAETSAYTAVGTTDGSYQGRTVTVNSFETGLAWYNTTHFGGNGSQVTWPLTSGTYQGQCVAGNFRWYDQVLSSIGCVDTAYWPVQDIGILVQCQYNVPTGINNVVSSGLSVSQNYPNPFNKETTIAYSLTKSSDVTFSVYDITGRVITTTNYGSVAPGQYQVKLNANTFSPGIYFYTFNVNGSIVTNKMVITE